MTKVCKCLKLKRPASIIHAPMQSNTAPQEFVLPMIDFLLGVGRDNHRSFTGCVHGYSTRNKSVPALIKLIYSSSTSTLRIRFSTYICMVYGKLDSHLESKVHFFGQD